MDASQASRYNQIELSNDAVTAPIIGASKMSHLEDAVRALDVKLTPEEIQYLEEPYKPHSIAGNYS